MDRPFLEQNIVLPEEHRQRIERAAAALADLAPELRPAAIEALCGDDETLRDALRDRTRLLEDEDALLTRVRSAVRDEILSPERRTTVASPPSTGQSAAKRMIGPYRIERRLGGGGMGEVFLATIDLPIRRAVAVKVIRLGFDSDEFLARFESERRAIARLEHPNIARLLDAGRTATARPYIVMEYVPGVPITSFADQERLSIEDRLALFINVCHAVAHAHMKAVIHRDLKPSNVLAWKDETNVSDATHSAMHIKVIDFGIAKVQGISELRPGITRVGTPLGTFEYMSPEQAAGQDEIDTRSDVYSLGVLLYELIAGCRPFERAEANRSSEEELRRLVLESPPARPSVRLRSMSAQDQHAIAGARSTTPRALVRLIGRELEWIPLRALRKEPARRYESVQEMALDVQNYLSNLPLKAGPESRLYLVRKFMVRHRAWVAAALLLIMLLVFGTAGTTWGKWEADRQRSNALAREQEARSAAYRSIIFAAESAVRSGDGAWAYAALGMADPDRRGWEWDHLQHRAGASLVRYVPEEPEPLLLPLPLADNRHAWFWSESKGAARLLGLSSGKTERVRSARAVAVHAQRDLSVWHLPDGSIEATSGDATTRYWLLPAPQTGHFGLARHSISVDGSMVAIRSADGAELLIVSSEDGTVLRRIPASQPIERVVGIFPRANSNQHEVWYQAESGRTYGVDLTTGAVSMPDTGSVVVDQTSTFSGNRQALVVHQTGEIIALAGTDATTVSSMLILPGSGLICSGHTSGSVRLYDRDGWRLLGTAIVGSTGVSFLSATPDGRRLIASLRGGTTVVVDVDALSSANRVASAAATRALFSRDRSKMLSLYWGSVQCTDAASGMPIWGANLGPYHNVAGDFSPDGRLVAVVAQGPEPELFILDAATGAQRVAMSVSPAHIDPARPMKSAPWKGSVSAIRFSNDGTKLWVARQDGSVFAVDAMTWEQIVGLSAPTLPDGVKESRAPTDLGGRGLLLTPDDQFLIQIASVSHHAADATTAPSAPLGVVVVRDARTLEIVSRIEWPPRQGKDIPSIGRERGNVRCISLSPDGKLLCIGFGAAEGGGSRVVSMELPGTTATLQPQWSVEIPQLQEITSAEFDVTATRLAVVGSDNRLRLLNAKSGDLIFTTDLESGWSFGVNFTPENRMIVATIAATSFFDVIGAIHSSEISAGRWPKDVPLPDSVEKMRRSLARVMPALLELRNQPVLGQSSAQAIALRIPDPDDQRLALALMERVPAPLNDLNNRALQILLLGESATAAQLSEAEAALRQAVAMKPHSLNLQANLGWLLFRSERFREALEPLREHVRLSEARGETPAPVTLLRLAIAESKLDEPEAAARLRQAQQAIDGAAPDPELQALLEMAKPWQAPVPERAK